VGDKVLVDAEHINVPNKKANPKLEDQFFGPFTVTRVITPVTVELDLPDNIKRSRTFNIKALKPYHDSPAQFSSRVPARPPATATASGTSEYEVEKIYGQRIFRKRKQYLVKWKGYPEYEMSWEPEAHLTNAKEAIDEFLKGEGV